MHISPSTPLAIIGVSTDSTKYGNRIFTDLLHAGYLVYGVNPKGGTVEGQTLYTSLTTLPHKPEVVMTVVPPQVTLDIVDICNELGVQYIWMQPGSASSEAIHKAHECGIEVVAEACFMKQSGLWK